MGKGIRSLKKRREHRNMVKGRQSRNINKNESEMDKEISEELNELDMELDDVNPNNSLKEVEEVEEVKEEPKKRNVEEVAADLVNTLYKDIDDKQLKKMLKNMSSDPKVLNMLNMLK